MPAQDDGYPQFGVDVKEVRRLILEDAGAILFQAKDRFTDNAGILPSQFSVHLNEAVINSRIILPWLELLCGLLLVANVRTAPALAWTAGLCAVFAICTGQAWARGLHIDCGCLDLDAIGIHRGSKAAGFLESAGFAFTRALLLGGIAWWLLAAEGRGETGVELGKA